MREATEPTRRPRRNRAILVSAVAVAFCWVAGAGCKPNKRYDLIEAELRTRERQLAETQAALEQSRNINRAYEHGRTAPVVVPGVSTSNSAATGIREVVLGRGTGGVDDDNQPGDETLMVVVVPRDEDRSEVKVIGRLQVLAWEINPQGLKNPIGSWDVSADRLRPTWRSSVLNTGYFVSLPWQSYPTTDKVRVAVRFITTDGRTFETDRDVTVRPVPEAMPRGVPGPAVPAPAVPGREPIFPTNPPPGVPSVLPPGTEELPPPKGVGLRPPQ
jgi:hypothetical protein